MEEALLKGRGVRFAPSPTGRFHLGNLRTAWISRQWARALSEPWVVRFEDIDAPRVLEGALEGQLGDMRALGLVPDELLIQSRFRARHWEAFVRAAREGRAYPCVCSRKEVRDAIDASASAPHPVTPVSGAQPVAVYSGRCRQAMREGKTCAPAHSLGKGASLGWRFAVEEDPSGLLDFVVARTDVELGVDGLPSEASFVPAYHWACAIDDWDGRYSLLVRAADLAEVVAQHRAIMAWLALSEGVEARFPAVFHTALVTQEDGSRLEKRTRGVTLGELRAGGLGPEELVSRFAASFRLDASGFAPGAVFGEDRSSLTLSQAGFGGAG